MLKSYLKQDNVLPTPTQHYLVSIRLQHKISFVKSFTFSKRLKKYQLVLVGRIVYNPHVYKKLKTNIIIIKNMLIRF